jgi:hypothetical protein
MNAVKKQKQRRNAYLYMQHIQNNVKKQNYEIAKKK